VSSRFGPDDDQPAVPAQGGARRPGAPSQRDRATDLTASSSLFEFGELEEPPLEEPDYSEYGDDVH
jgi:hypothetical protein